MLLFAEPETAVRILIVDIFGVVQLLGGEFDSTPPNMESAAYRY